MPAEDLVKLSNKIEKLSPPDQLRLAARLLEEGNPILAETIAGRIVDELRILKAFGRLK